MIARNFQPQSQWLSGYARFLQLSDEDFLDVDQLKPTDSNNLSTLQHQLENLQNDGASNQRTQGENQFDPQQPDQAGDYYELTSLDQTPCFTPMFLGGSSDGSGQQGACEAGVVSVGSGAAPGTPSSNPALQPEGLTRNGSRKRRNSYQDASDFDDDTEDSKSCRTDGKKQNHSEIEKRRRDKMNTYITELSSMVPMCHAMSRKLDKLTVLRMAVQHLRTIRGAVHSYAEGNYKPAFLSDEDLKQLILQTAEGFLFVVGCDRGRILFVSESVSQCLNFSQGDLLGQSWFDILHPKDVAKVKEQLSSSDLSPRERLIDAKTMLPVKADVPSGGSRLCPGARRSFFCRMKRKCPSPFKEEGDSSGGGAPSTPSNTNASATPSTGATGSSAGAQNTGRLQRKAQGDNDRKYCVVHCTGYLKWWAPEKVGLSEPTEISEVEGDTDGEASNLLCLVAVGRLQPVLAPATTQSTPKNPSAPVPAQPPTPQPPATPRQVQRINRRVPPLRPLQFTSKHAVDGKFLFVDQSTFSLVRATRVSTGPGERLEMANDWNFKKESLCGATWRTIWEKWLTRLKSGKPLGVVNQATPVLGFLPQELLGTSMYEYYHPDDVEHLAASHKAALATTERVKPKVYWFRNKDNSYVCLQSEWRAFKNPWTKDVEYLISKNTVIRTDTGLQEVSTLPKERPCQSGYDFFSQRTGNPREMQNAISSHVEASKIGRQVADEALDRPRPYQDCDRTPKSPNVSGTTQVPSPSQSDSTPRSFNTQVEIKQTGMNPPQGGLLPPPAPRLVTSVAGSLMAAVMSPVSAAATPVSSTTSSPQRDLTCQRPGHKSPLTATSATAATPPSPATECRLSSPVLSRTSETGSYGNGTIRNNVTLSSLASSEPGLGNEEDVAEMMGSVLAESPGQGVPGDSNDEAAMAVIMSLLEAESELGERIDFSGLPWPLP